MPAKTQPFVQWYMLQAAPKGEEQLHLCRVPFSYRAMCGARVGLAATAELRKHTRRCPKCLKLYLRTMTATDELVGAFGEDGRIRK